MATWMRDKIRKKEEWRTQTQWGQKKKPVDLFRSEGENPIGQEESKKEPGNVDTKPREIYRERSGRGGLWRGSVEG